MDWQIHQPTAKVWLPVPISYGILWQVLFHYRQVILVPASSENFWQKVAKGLGTGHSAMACQQQYYSHTEKPSKPRKLICAKKAEVSDEELSKGNTRVCVCVCGHVHVYVWPLLEFADCLCRFIASLCNLWSIPCPAVDKPMTISGRVGTLKRKRELRLALHHIDKDYSDNVWDAPYLKKKLRRIDVC